MQPVLKMMFDENNHIFNHKDSRIDQGVGASLHLPLDLQFETRVAPLLVQLGLLKAELDRKDPRVHRLEARIQESTLELIEDLPTDHPFLKVVHRYYACAHEFIESVTKGNDESRAAQAAGMFRKFIEAAFSVTLHNANAFKESLAADPKTVVVFNHYNRSPEINGIANSPDFGQAILGHDMTPVISQILSSLAVGLTGRQVSRFGKPLFANDQFYYGAAERIGHQALGDSFANIANQIRHTWRDNKIPTVCPEAGLRSLRVWKTGAVVAAAMAGATTITIIAECPWISLMVPKKEYHFVGSIRIPQEVVYAVRHDTDRKAVGEFSELIRGMLGDFILHKTEFSTSYKEAVKDNIQTN